MEEAQRRRRRRVDDELGKKWKTENNDSLNVEKYLVISEWMLWGNDRIWTVTSESGELET